MRKPNISLKSDSADLSILTLYVVIIGIYHVTKFPEILFHCHKLLVAEFFIGFRFQLGIEGVKPFRLVAQGFS